LEMGLRTSGTDQGRIWLCEVFCIFRFLLWYQTYMLWPYFSHLQHTTSTCTNLIRTGLLYFFGQISISYKKCGKCKHVMCITTSVINTPPLLKKCLSSSKDNRIYF
jgi:hypothetical protein